VNQSAVSSERKLFHQEKQVLTPEACDYLTTAFEGLTEFRREYRNTVTINYNDLPLTSRSKRILNHVRLAVADVVRREFGETRVYANLTQIVRWPEGSSQPLHKDDPAFTTYACILNLNDDYEGGRTLVPGLNMKIEPLKGQASIFYGCELDHGVEKVIRGTRYTVPVWFVNDVAKAEL
jgi:hypothetical protein